MTKKKPGRPKTKTPAVRFQVTLPPRVFKMLESQRGNMPRSTYLQGLIYGSALARAAVIGKFIAYGIVKGPMDERTDEVCLAAMGKTAHRHLGTPPHKTSNPDLECRCVIMPLLPVVDPIEEKSNEL